MAKKTGKYTGYSYEARLRIYESKKRELLSTCTDYKEYEKEIKKLVNELNI